MNANYVFTDKPGWNVEEITKAEIDMRKQIWALHKLLKEKVPGFENSYIEKTAPYPLNRAHHRLVGDYVLSVNDMRQGRAFDDSIAISNQAPDLIETAPGVTYDILPHDIPYRCIVSKEVENLLGAGFTMSSGGFAVFGPRYITPSICIGQAAGAAAALAVKNKVSPKKLNVKLLQDTLRGRGARVTVKDVSEEVLEPYRVIQKLEMGRDISKSRGISEKDLEEWAKF